MGGLNALPEELEFVCPQGFDDGGRFADGVASLSRRSTSAMADSGGVLAGNGSREQRWRPRDLPWLEVLSVHAPDYSYPEFAMNKGYTFTLTYGGKAPPVRYRGLEYLPAAAGTITVVDPGEVIQSLATGPSAAHFTTFTLLDSQPLRDILNGELPTFGQLTYTDQELFTGFAALHVGLTKGVDLQTVQSRFAGLLHRLVSRHGIAADTAIDVHRPSNLRKVRHILSDRLDSNISLDELAAVAGYSRHHLVRAFRQAYGVPPHRYRTLLRLASARILLAQGVPVAEVAARLGYFDQSQLNRHFRDAFKVSAGTYARAIR